ncbi:hypothetical protein BSL78_18368 [Apostichopus japonicus]|uniref:Uncharacterized protein n=1 Tax=Stichopus japonicus TaxID=307972 RepID=A0A2G8K9W9_STIJA|nr:hypothetical protein BSL78_18368 [Apostichopus japonicus]
MQMQGSNRKLKYEWLRESQEDVSVPLQVAAIQMPKPLIPPFQETVGSQKTAGPNVQRSPRATRTAPTASDIANQTPPQHGNKRRQHHRTPRPPKKTKNDVRKSDRGGPTWRQTGTEPMAPDCAGEATLALLDVVENITSAGTPPKVPEEWLNCTPPLACSAICEAKF